MTKDEFKVGDVTVAHTGGTPGSVGHYSKPLKVKRVVTRFIELDDGTKWRHDGTPYGWNSTWGPNLIKYTEEVRQDRIKWVMVIRAQRHIKALYARRDDLDLMAQVYELTKHLLETDKVQEVPKGTL